MKINFDSALAELPLPATEKWPQGVWDIDAFNHGSMSLILFAPEGQDYQTPHSQDELYIVIKGSGVLEVNGEAFEFETGDVLFVPARAPHRFIEINDQLTMWAIFYGREGGE